MAYLLLSMTLLLGGRTERSHERYGDSNYEMSCTTTYGKTDGQ